MKECNRIRSDRRANDRRFNATSVATDRRVNQRRSGYDRRDMISDQVS